LEAERTENGESSRPDQHKHDEEAQNEFEEFCQRRPSLANSIGNMSLMSGSFHQERGPSFLSRIKGVISNVTFLCLCLVLTGFFLVVTGIQYWASDFLVEVFGEDHATVSIYFSITCFTGPISGVIVGGIITSKMGGYNTKKAQKLQVIMSTCALLCALPIPFLESYDAVATLFWGLLFFGGFVLPPLTGIMINTVP